MRMKRFEGIGTFASDLHHALLLRDSSRASLRTTVMSVHLGCLVGAHACVRRMYLEPADGGAVRRVLTRIDLLRMHPKKLDAQRQEECEEEKMLFILQADNSRQLIRISQCLIDCSRPEVGLHRCTWATMRWDDAVIAVRIYFSFRHQASAVDETTQGVWSWLRSQ